MSTFYYYDLDYSEVFIFDQFLINQIREGVTVTRKHNVKLKETIDKHFKNKPLVYISNRIFSYSVDPMTYIETSKIHNLLAIAIVSEDKLNRKNAMYESAFYKKPLKVYDNLSEAISWVHQVILEHD